MSAPSSGRLLPIAVCAGLCLLLAAQILMPAPAARPVAGRDLTDLPSLPAPASPPADMTPALARPLFSPGRGPVDQTAAVSASAALSDFTLAGVVSSGGGGLALFRNPAGATVSVGLGANLLGWRVAAVGHDGVTLAHGEQQRVVAIGAPAAPKAGGL